MKKYVLIINNHDSFTYNLVDLTRRLNVPFGVIAIENLRPAHVERSSHLLISPGPDTPDAYPQLFEIMEIYHQKKTILGVCLGHQTICQFFGANLYNLSNVRHGQAKQLKVRSNSGLFCGLPQQFQIGLYHSWAVFPSNFPKNLTVTAVCEDNIIMAIQHNTLPIYGVQFHPESCISEYGKEILANFLK